MTHWINVIRFVQNGEDIKCHECDKVLLTKELVNVFEDRPDDPDFFCMECLQKIADKKEMWGRMKLK